MCDLCPIGVQNFAIALSSAPLAERSARKRKIIFVKKSNSCAPHGGHTTSDVSRCF
jgi:hypothetical protein